MKTTLILHNKAILYDQETIITITAKEAIQSYLAAPNQNTFFGAPYFNYLIQSSGIIAKKMIQQHCTEFFQDHPSNPKQIAEVYVIEQEKTIFSLYQPTEHAKHILDIRKNKFQYQCFYPFLVKHLVNMRHQLSTALVFQIDTTALFFIPSLLEFYFLNDWSHNEYFLLKKIHAFTQNKHFNKYQFINVSDQSWIQFIQNHQVEKKKNFKIIQYKNNFLQKEKKGLIIISAILLITLIIILGLKAFKNNIIASHQIKQSEISKIIKDTRQVKDLYQKEMKDKIEQIIDTIESKNKNIWISSFKIQEKKINFKYNSLNFNDAKHFTKNILNHLKGYQLKTEQIKEIEKNNHKIFQLNIELMHEK